MPKNINSKDIIYLLIWFGISILITTFVLIWYLGINTQLYSIITSQKPNEEKLGSYASTLKDYALISLTLFGVTFIGGIFELHKKEKSVVGRLERNTKLLVFLSSILFLISFISLLMLYSLIYPIISLNLPETLLSVLLFLGVGFFTVSIITLLLILILYLIRIVTTPQEIQPDIVD